MKLYDVSRNTLVKVLPVAEMETVPGEQLESVKVPPAGIRIDENQYIYFGHIDGMYSYCHTMDGELCHMALWTEVEPVDMTYENIELLRTVVKRGGRGKDGNQPLTYVPICEMNDEWLANAITYNKEIQFDIGHTQLYKWEQQYRKEHGITIGT